MAAKLPTKRDTERFMRAINKGRAAFGLGPVEKLDFDACLPGDPWGCLSARHLISAVDDEASVGGSTFFLSRPEDADTLAGALGLRSTEGWGRSCVVIPPEISAVTNPFDQRVPGLRERLVKHGVVDG